MTRSDDLRRIARELGDVVAEKNEAYGDAFNKAGEILRILYPDGIKPSKYDDMLTVVRVLDKLFRVATNRDALGESPFRDITGYGILATERTERKAEECRAKLNAGAAPAPVEQPNPRVCGYCSRRRHRCPSKCP